MDEQTSLELIYTLSIFESFKERVLEVRKAVEEFKDNHKMASEAISLVIDSMPEPFNKFSSMIWNGLENQAEGAGDSSAKLLEILEKIENNTEKSFSEIKTNISELIRLGAKTEDIEKLGEQIRISNESVIQNLKETFNDELKKAAQRLEEGFENNLIELRLSESNLSLVTIVTEFGVGNRDCWKLGYFRDEDIKSGYDARRPIIDKIISSIDSNDNIGTILYGKRYYGKGIILKRIMFEQIDKGYAVVFGDGIRAAETQLLVKLLNRITDRFPKVLVIADNVHRRGSEVLFEAFNYFATKEKSRNIIKFLFGAREEEFKITKEALESKKAAEIDVALRRIHQIRIGFSLEDAVLFLKKASTVSKQREISEQNASMMSDIAYKRSKGDPFMFVLSLMAMISGEDTSAPMEFLTRDLNEKIISLGKDKRLLKAALLCSFMGLFGIPLITGVLESNRLYKNHLKSLVAKDFLLQNDEYKTRHEAWILQFLIQIYSKDFDNDFASFNFKYNVKDMISSILNNIDSNYMINILIICAMLYRAERSKPIAKVIVDNYFVPDHFNSNKKAEVYTFGLGNFYYSIKDYIRSLECFNKALVIDPDNAGALNYKGLALFNLKDYEEAIEYYDKALAIDPNHVLALNNKGEVLRKLEKYERAIACYDKALAIDPNFVYSLGNKGIALLESGKIKEAIVYFDKVLAIDPNDFRALTVKGKALVQSWKIEEAIVYFDKVLAIDPNDVDARIRDVLHASKGEALDSLGRYAEAIVSYDKVLDIDQNNVNALNDKGIILNHLGRYAEAIVSYDKVLAIDPNNLIALQGKGVALGRLDKKEEAIEYFDKILAIDPNNIDALNEQGDTLDLLGRYAEAIVSYDKVLAIDPNNLVALHGKFMPLIKLERKEEAAEYATKWYDKMEQKAQEDIENFDKVLAIDPNNLIALQGKGVALGRLDKKEEAIEYFDKILVIDPNNIDALNNKGHSLAYLGKNKEAIEYFDKILVIDPNNIDALNQKEGLISFLQFRKDYADS